MGEVQEIAEEVSYAWDVIKLQLFLFSLRDVAVTCFDSLPVGSVNTWEELVEVFMSRFFPPDLTAERR